MSRGAWTQHSTELVFAAAHLRVRRDDVAAPSGARLTYELVEVADQVRVATFVDGRLILVEQNHYLIGTSLQLPGGNVEGDEPAEQAAARELRQETGLHGGQWDRRGAVHPLPGLSPAKVHLWVARDLETGPAELELSEADLRVVSLGLDEAVDAVRQGRVTCAGSATLILLLALLDAASPEPGSAA